VVGHGDDVAALMCSYEHGGRADDGIVMPGESFTAFGRIRFAMPRGPQLRIQVVKPCGEFFRKTTGIHEHQCGGVLKHLVQHATLDGRPYRTSRSTGVEHIR